MTVAVQSINTARISVLRDTATNFRILNPILDEGELGLELDTGLFKFGDGTRSWIYLPYANTIPAPEDGYYLRKGNEWIKLANDTNALSFETWQLTMDDGTVRSIQVLVAEQTITQAGVVPQAGEE